MKPLVIYHSNCADGFSAAWCFHHKDPLAFDFYPGVHNDPPPDVTDRDVYLVDFSYKRDVLLRMARTARSITIWDHHLSAATDLTHLSEDVAAAGGYCPIEVVFDMERSGAGLTWDMIFPDTPRPALIDYVEDRDLWRFNLLYSREISMGLFSYEYTFEGWDGLMAASTNEILRLADEGRAIDRKHKKDIAELLAVCRSTMRIGGHVVPVANLPYTMASDAAGFMAETAPFAATYYDTATHRVFSLRSRGEGGLDVSVIASLYGGGGHKNAAGFRVLLADIDTYGLGIAHE